MPHLRRPLRISQFSSPFLITVEKDVGLDVVMEMMEESAVRHMPVVENEHPVGIISDRDLKVFEGREFASKFCAGDIMIANPYRVDEDTDLHDVVATMSDKKYGSCLVENKKNEIIAIFTMVDALRTLKILLERDPSIDVAFKELPD